MLSHGCFFAALLVYYIPKAFGKKTKLTVNLHIILGSLAVIGMLYETAMKIGTESFLKYAGFSCVMLAIAGTGYLITKNGRSSVKWHILATISFFTYLMMIIVL
ncbi:MAG: hypothetical protein Q3980_00680 [Turicibacter sp.]|nr:hypothetical protein [Turicibacter sp.]